MKSHALSKLVALVVIAAAIGAGGFALWMRSPLTASQNVPSSYGELIALPEGDLRRVDIAVMNLLSAEGLPGAESLNVKQCLTMLAQWAELVRQNERKYLPQFHRNPACYDNSLAVFEAVNLALTLKQDLGCDYNKGLVTSGVMADIRSTRFFGDSSDIFLHGFTEKRRGSCASLPVLMVAVGRRCGYPLYLAASKGHLFCR